MSDEKYLKGTIGDSNSYTVINTGGAMSTVRNLYYEQLQEQNSENYVKVVRCKDCIYYGDYEDGKDVCSMMIIYPTKPTDYCSLGEKKEDAD